MSVAPVCGAGTGKINDADIDTLRRASDREPVARSVSVMTDDAAPEWTCSVAARDEHHDPAGADDRPTVPIAVHGLDGESGVG